MNKRVLEQYIALQSELNNRDRRIRELEEKRAEIDNMEQIVVTASMDEFPYLPHHVHLEGITNSDVSLLIHEINNEIRTHRRMYRKLLRSTRDVLKYIDGVEDSLVRQALQLRYIEGKTWDEVAKHIGGGNSSDSVRKAVSRYLRKN